MKKYQQEIEELRRLLEEGSGESSSGDEGTGDSPDEDADDDKNGLNFFFNSSLCFLTFFTVYFNLCASFSSILVSYIWPGLPFGPYLLK